MLAESIGVPAYFIDEYAVRFTLNIVITTAIWLTVTFLTRPEKERHLVAFYERIRPAGKWGPIARKASTPDHLRVGWIEWVCWFLGVTGLFAMIFSVGNACFGSYQDSIAFGLYGIVATVIIFKLLRKMDWSSITSSAEEKQ